jgi:hypothetical protein
MGNRAAALTAALREEGDRTFWWLPVLAASDIRHFHEDGLAIIPNMRGKWRVGVKR